MSTIAVTGASGFCGSHVAVAAAASIRLSLTAVENLSDACLDAAGWPPGAYNIADPAPYDRDRAVRAVLRAHGVRARIRHVPPAVARTAARGRPGAGPTAPGNGAAAHPLRGRPARRPGRPGRVQGGVPRLDSAPRPGRLHGGRAVRDVGLAGPRIAVAAGAD
ncbi:hypothetical protein [Streptomyces echinatus]|uniref:hypothetical protein n=1 Tax=Streptomyces echinatus TaxID=67293 RepID=UPI0031EFDDD3